MKKQFVLAFVGADMTGKTQIAKEVARRLGVPYFKARSEHDTFLYNQNRFKLQLQYADTRMVDFLKQTGHSVVMDRCWICEKVYSYVLKRETDLGSLDFVDSTMASIDARIVHCYRTSYAGISDDLDSRLDEKALTLLTSTYAKVLSSWTRCKTYSLCVDDEDLDREAAEVVAWVGG